MFQELPQGCDMRKIFIPFMALAVFMSPVAAYAQKPVSDEGLAQVKQVVDDALKFEREVAAKSGSGLKLSADPQITNKGSYYEVRLPDVSYNYPSIGVIDIGTIVLNVTHGKTDNEYLASMAVQPTMTFTADDGEKLVMNIGGQKFAMAWQAHLRSPTRVDAEYKDIKLKADGKDKFDALIANTRIVANLQENSDGTWSGPIETEMTDISADLPASETAGAAKIKLARFYNKSDYDSLDLALALSSKKKVEEMVRGAGGKNIEDTELALTTMLEDGASFFGGTKSEVIVKGFSADVAALPPKEGQTPEQPRSLRLAEFNSVVEMKGLKSDKGNIAAQVAVKDLVANNVVDPEAAGYLPQNANVEIYLDDMPLQSLYKAFAGLLIQGTRAAKMAEEAEARGQPSNMKRHHESQVMAAAFAIPQMLTSAGSKVAVRNTFMRAPDLTTEIFGEFKAVPGAAKIGVGEMTMNIFGLDELLKKLETSNTRQGRKAVQGLSFLQVLGQQDTKDGKPVRKYVFAVTAEGRMTLNGADIGGLMGGLPQ